MGLNRLQFNVKDPDAAMSEIGYDLGRHYPISPKSLPTMLHWCCGCGCCPDCCSVTVKATIWPLESDW